MKRASSRRQGFTLIELMVATGLMIVLGLMLITSLTATVDVVNRGTSRGDAWVRAQSILARVEDDLVQLHAAEKDGRLVAGRDPLDQPFLVFTRALPEERVYASGIFAARKPNDLRNSQGYTKVWRGRSAADGYRAQGGVAAVAYVLRDDGPTTSLYRAIMAPIGESRVATMREDYAGPSAAANDLFTDLETWHLLGKGQSQEFPADLNFGATFDHFASDVLYLGVEFLDPALEKAANQPVWRHNWETLARADLRSTLARSGNWPAEARSQVIERNVERARITLPANKNAPIYSRMPRQLGMGFPSAARISVTVAQKIPFDADTTLASALDASATTIQLSDASRFQQKLDQTQNVILIGKEWIRFGAIAGNTLTECERGIRGSKATSHEVGTRARQGLTLSKIVRMPQS